MTEQPQQESHPSDPVRVHYEAHPYPHFSYLASVRACDTYALNAESLWARANGCLPPPGRQRILLAGCGSFSPYPTSLANPHAEITALDLAGANLRRARVHAILHGRRNILFEQGDLLDRAKAPGLFAFIDAFGVLHHLPEPLEGLRALERRLLPGGVIRVMVYSRAARREEESIRRALNLLGIRDLTSLRGLVGKADESSRFGSYLRASAEARTASGMADALLHPRVTTFKTDELLSLIRQAGLKPLFFAHEGALPDVEEEVARLRRSELEGTLLTNFIAYLGRREPYTANGSEMQTNAILNPALRGCVQRPHVRAVVIAPKLGFPNPPLDRRARRFLKQFSSPRKISALSPAEVNLAELFLNAMFLVKIRTS